MLELGDIVSVSICWYDRLMKGLPAADLAPAHAGVPALRVVGVEDVEEVERCLPGSGGWLETPMTVAMVAVSEMLRRVDPTHTHRSCVY